MTAIIRPDQKEYLIYVNGGTYRRLTHPDQAEAVRIAYKTCTGRDIPQFELGTPDEPSHGGAQRGMRPERKLCDRCGYVMMATYRPSDFWDGGWIWAWYCQSCGNTIPIADMDKDARFGRKDAIQSYVE